VSRSGYTGEDGFEVVLPSERAESFARRVLADDRVAAAGLGARDTLRLEAGLCLYGNDLDETTTPVEAGLRWIMQKRRREEGGFLGDDVILGQLADRPPRHRVGLQPTGRAPVRDHAVITIGDETVGEVTSGGFGPSIDKPIAMGYVASGHHDVGTQLTAQQRNKEHDLVVADLPFVPHRYVRGTS
jgi:aminomethyltransferase